MAAILQMILSSVSSWMKIFIFWFKFRGILFLRVQLTINQHWFRQWLGADKGTSHYLNQWWLSVLRHIRVTQFWWVKYFTVQYTCMGLNHCTCRSPNNAKPSASTVLTTRSDIFKMADDISRNCGTLSIKTAPNPGSKASCPHIWLVMYWTSQGVSS